MIVLTTVVPVYNGEKHIAKTLRSVAQQTRRPELLIILDNQSTDTTQAIVAQFREMPCEWRQNEKNLGLFGNLNRALEFASETQYLHLLHADDLIKPDFYQRCLAALESAPGRALVFCPPQFIDEDDKLVPGRRHGPRRALRAISRKEFLVARSELRPIYFPGVLLKTAGCSSLCHFRSDLRQLADQVFWAEWGVNCSTIIELSEALCQYRLHGGSDTSVNVSNLQAWVLDEWKSMELIARLLNESGFSRWLRRQKLKCIFAARSQVKMQLVRKSSPKFAAEIHRASRKIVNPVHWASAGFAVLLRDWFVPN